VAEQAKVIAAEQGRDTINSADVKKAKAKRKAGTVYHCAECRNTFTESDGDCPRCHPPEPETVEFVQAEDHDFELTFAVVCGSFSRRVFDARSHWTPDQVKRLKTEIDAFFSCEVPPEYREAL
jgi:predicted ATP-dependent serine protease